MLVQNPHDLYGSVRSVAEYQDVPRALHDSDLGPRPNSAEVQAIGSEFLSQIATKDHAGSRRILGDIQHRAHQERFVPPTRGIAEGLLRPIQNRLQITGGDRRDDEPRYVRRFPGGEISPPPAD